jgi:hypothetical protein
MKRTLLCSLAASAVFAMPISNAAAASRTPLTVADQQRTPLVRVGANGILIDRDGWRNNHSWDNTCLRTLDYLPSESACSGIGGF